MTKKTNSLIFRYGLNTFWKNKSYDKKAALNFLRLENIINYQLCKNRLTLLKLDYHINKLVIYVHNEFQLNEVIKEQIIVYYKKIRKINRVVNKFGLHKDLVISILEKKNLFQKILKKQTVQLKPKTLVQICFNKYFLKNLFMLCNNLTNLWYCNFGFSLMGLFRWNFQHIEYQKETVLSTYHRKKFRKISGLLKFKLFSIQLESIIFLNSGNFFRLELINIFLIKNFFVQGKLSRYNFKNIENRIIFSILQLSTFYKTSHLISQYISTQIKKSKNHYRILKQFLREVYKYFNDNVIKMKGLQVWVTGKITGKMRKSKYHYKIGVVQLQTLKTFISYSLSLSYTKFGIISVKTWISHETN